MSLSRNRLNEWAPLMGMGRSSVMLAWNVTKRSHSQGTGFIPSSSVRMTALVPACATTTMRRSGAGRFHSGGNGCAGVAPSATIQRRSPEVTRSWKARKLSPPGRPSQCSSTWRPRASAKTRSMSSAGVVSHASGLPISASHSSVTGAMPVAAARGATVCCARRSGETTIASMSTVARRSAVRSAWASPRSVSGGFVTPMPSRVHAG